MKPYDAAALGSDVPRSYRQYLARRWATLVVKTLGLNRPGFLSTEIVQQIHPVCTIRTRRNPIQCLGGHGRLRWRALTFYTEEPDTVHWLDTLQQGDVLWDIGANVGLYAIYAAAVSKCRVVAFEPEAQNYAILLENIALNKLQSCIEASNLAVTKSIGIGKLYVHAMTKGGAYNQFHVSNGSNASEGSAMTSSVVQIQMGVSLDDLVTTFGFPCPTNIKIDVDGNEPDIIAGGTHVLGSPQCRSVLLEVRHDDPAHLQMVEALRGFGYHCVSQYAGWESRMSPERAKAWPYTNMIFDKAGEGVPLSRHG